MIKFKSIKIKREYAFVIILIIAVIIVIFLSFYDKDNSVATSSSTDQYVANLESKIKDGILKIDGVKNATVIISVKNGITTVIAEDVKNVDENGKQTYTSTPVLVSGKPIVLGEIFPEIIGVVVVCECNNNFALNSYVLDVVTTVLDIPYDKVRILIQ